GVLPDVRGLNGTDMFENTKILIELEKRASQFNGPGGDLFPRHHIKWPRTRKLPPIPRQSWLMATLCDVERVASNNPHGTSAYHMGWSTRCRSRQMPPRPYIWLSNFFSRLIWPSTGPVLHGRVTPASTASSSARNPLAKL